MMIGPKSWFHILKHTTLEVKEAKGLEGIAWTHISPRT